MLYGVIDPRIIGSVLGEVSLASDSATSSLSELIIEFETGELAFKLSYEEIENIAGAPVDHSFLTYKKELLNYGYKVGKISMKEQTIEFVKDIVI